MKWQTRKYIFQEFKYFLGSEFHIQFDSSIIKTILKVINKKT